MKCPKCTGLLIEEDIREQSGRFQGWRCIQCGFRLDHLIVQNRTSAPPDVTDEDGEDAPTRTSRPARRTPARRAKCATSKA